MASKQTAVEWLKERLFDPYIMDRLMTNQYYREPLQFEIQDLFERAKAMEKQQIVETYNEGALDGLQLGEQYYNYVFNS
jgi:hypothetical protein